MMESWTHAADLAEVRNSTVFHTPLVFPQVFVISVHVVVCRRPDKIRAEKRASIARDKRGPKSSLGLSCFSVFGYVTSTVTEQAPQKPSGNSRLPSIELRKPTNAGIHYTES